MPCRVICVFFANLCVSAALRQNPIRREAQFSSAGTAGPTRIPTLEHFAGPHSGPYLYVSQMIDEQHSDSAGLPLVEELREPPGVMAALQAVSDLPGVLLLDSALQREPVGRYSYLMADPVWFRVHGTVGFGTDPFAEIRLLLDRYATSAVLDLPPFQGGAAGLLGYELGSAFERITPPWRDEFHLPRMAVGLYDRVLAWDHRQNRAWIVSHGIQPGSSDDRTDRAAKRLEELRERLALTARSTTLAGSNIAEVMASPVTADHLAP